MIASAASKSAPMAASSPRYFFLEAQKPAESKMPWDVFNILATTPADQAFRPLAENACPMLKT